MCNVWGTCRRVCVGVWFCGTSSVCSPLTGRSCRLNCTTSVNTAGMYRLDCEAYTIGPLSASLKIINFIL